MSEQNQQPNQEQPVAETVTSPAPAPATMEVNAEPTPVVEQAPPPPPEPVDSPAPKVSYPGKPNKPQVVQQPKAAVKVTTVPDVTDFDQLVGKLRNSGTAAEVALITTLDSYIENMKPGRPIDGSAGVAFQYKLWNALHRVVEDSPTQEFNKLWNLVVAYFRHYQKGVFNGQYVNRFAEFWVRSEDDLYSFQQLTNLLSIAATNPQYLTKLVSITKVVEKTFTEVGRGRLIGLYS